MRIETISYLKNNAATLEVEEPITITQNGKPTYVIESYEQRKKRDETIALLKLATFSVEDEKQGRVKSSDDFKASLVNRITSLQKSS